MHFYNRYGFRTFLFTVTRKKTDLTSISFEEVYFQADLRLEPNMVIGPDPITGGISAVIGIFLDDGYLDVYEQQYII